MMKNKKFIKEYIEPIVIAILIALFIRAFIVQAFKIPSSSMEPTLLVGDHLLVNKFIYGIRIPYSDCEFGFSRNFPFILKYPKIPKDPPSGKFFKYKSPHRGDIVVFIFPKDRKKDFIKRVIGIEGEKVEIVRNKIYINDKLIDDPWGYFEKPTPSIEDFGPVKVPKDFLFVMGDNRNNSQDSRFWGFVHVNDVKGKAFMVYFSWNSNAQNLWNMVRWNRFGKLIH